MEILLNQKKNSPKIIMNKRGINFAIVVNIWIFADDLTPREDVKVKNQMKESPVIEAKMGFLFNSGMKKLNALTIATAIAALFTQHDIQYPHATKKPKKSPRTTLVYK